MFAGGLGQFIASPTDLVKVQMQMEGRRRLEGKPPRQVILKTSQISVILHCAINVLDRCRTPSSRFVHLSVLKF